MDLTEPLKTHLKQIDTEKVKTDGKRCIQQVLTKETYLNKMMKGTTKKK